MKKYAFMLLVVLAFHTVGWGSVIGLINPGTSLIPNSSLHLRPSAQVYSTLPSSVRLNLHQGLNPCTTVGLNQLSIRYPTPIRPATLCRVPSLSVGVRPVPSVVTSLYPALLPGLGRNVNVDVDVSRISHVSGPANGGDQSGTVVWGTSNSSSSSSQSP